MDKLFNGKYEGYETWTRRRLAQKNGRNFESNEMQHLKDSVETCVGYQELFVKDFEKIHEKIWTMTGKIENFERRMDGITENGPNLAILGDKIEKLAQELRGKIDFMSNRLTDINESFVKEVTSLNLESNEKKTKKETNLKCNNRECNSNLRKNVPLREDGVSVQCPKCPFPNIVGKLNEGHKWMAMYCNEYHFQQFTHYKKNGDKEKCQVCGKEGILRDAYNRMAVPC